MSDLNLLSELNMCDLNLLRELNTSEWAHYV